MIINHNCCIKLVPLVIFIYDARSHIHQTQKNLKINVQYAVTSCCGQHVKMSRRKALCDTSRSAVVFSAELSLSGN